MSEPKRHVVRPFGLLDRPYEVDRAGLVKYLLSCAIALVVIGVCTFRTQIGVPLGLAVAIALAGIVGTFVLSYDVARKGRKL